MALFKQKVNFQGFIAITMTHSFKYFRTEAKKLAEAGGAVGLKTDYDNAGETEKEQIWEFTPYLVAGNLLSSSAICFRNKVSVEEIKETILRVYDGYATEILIQPKKERQKTLEFLGKFLNSFGREVDLEKADMNEIRGSLPKFFAKVFSASESQKNAMVDVAELFTNGDIVGHFLKEFKVIF